MTTFETVSYGLIGVLVAFIVAMDLSIRHRGNRRAPNITASARTIRTTALAAAVALYFGTLVWRIRTINDVNENPLDLATLVRIGFDCLAGLIALIAWHRIARPRTDTLRGRFSPAVLYMIYVFIVLLGMLPALKPYQVGFRAFEIAAVPIVAAVLARTFTLAECLNIVKWLVYATAATVGASVLFFSNEAVVPMHGIMPFRIQGVLPNLAANSVGTLGLVLVAIGAGAKKVDRWAVFLGVSLIVLTQYRTGLLGLTAMIVTYAIVRWKFTAAVLFAGMAYPIYWLTTQPIVGQLWGRGEADAQTAALGGRTVLWTAAIRAADRSPLIGTGLTSGSRNEVLNQINGGVISTVHSTWVEAYIGTGLIGVSVIAIIFLQFVIDFLASPAPDARAPSAGRGDLGPSDHWYDHRARRQLPRVLRDRGRRDLAHSTGPRSRHPVSRRAPTQRPCRTPCSPSWPAPPPAKPLRASRYGCNIDASAPQLGRGGHQSGTRHQPRPSDGRCRPD